MRRLNSNVTGASGSFPTYVKAAGPRSNSGTLSRSCTTHNPWRPASWAWLFLALLIWLPGCVSIVQHGGSASLAGQSVRVFLAPYHNATGDEYAARALTELTATALLRRGVNLVQTESALAQARQETAAGSESALLAPARSVQATHMLIGTVHEYRYKTDLDGNPAVGITLRLVETNEGRTLWQGSSAQVGVLFASLSSVAQRAVRKLVQQIPF